MIRAGVFIGVDQTGGLRRLHDAASGAASMHAWALTQGMSAENARLITDEGGRRVSPDDVFDEVRRIIDGPGVDQLLIYFAGHGVNLNRNEHWLLTEAPVKASAAIDVTGSVALARYSGIRHVVVVSDACRVAPEGIQAQGVRGVDIFPNDVVGDRAQPVDQFFACLLGKTAAELRDPDATARHYSALYTSVLLDALHGKHPELLDRADGTPGGCVLPRRLQAFLQEEVPRRVKARKLQRKVNQNPDAIITSDGQWLSQLPDTGLGDREVRSGGPDVHVEWEPSEVARDPMADLAHAALSDDQAALASTLGDVSDRSARLGREVTGTLQLVSAPFGPDHFETNCGIKVRGARIRGVFAAQPVAEQLTDELVRLTGVGHPGCSVVVEVEGGFGAVVPALPGYLAGLTFEGQALVDVAYEPSARSESWKDFGPRAAELRTVRGVAAAASQHGRFRLQGDDAPLLARRLRLGKGLDPTLAVYAAHAFHDLQDVEHLQELSAYLHSGLGVGLFDVDLLARRLLGRALDSALPVLPFLPMLAQAWSLVRAYRVRLPARLADVEGSLRDSVWCLYDEVGLGAIKGALVTGEVR